MPCGVEVGIGTVYAPDGAHDVAAGMMLLLKVQTWFPATAHACEAMGSPATVRSWLLRRWPCARASPPKLVRLWETGRRRDPQPVACLCPGRPLYAADAAAAARPPPLPADAAGSDPPSTLPAAAQPVALAGRRIMRPVLSETSGAALCPSPTARSLAAEGSASSRRPRATALPVPAVVSAPATNTFVSSCIAACSKSEHAGYTGCGAPRRPHAAVRGSAAMQQCT